MKIIKASVKILARLRLFYCRRCGCGFSLIEVLISMVLVGVALLGMAQLFTLCVMQNARSEQVTNATFLAQAQVDYVRSLTQNEISAFLNYPVDEVLDINGDGTMDFRRITKILKPATSWEVKVLVFSAEQTSTARDELLQNPEQYRVRAQINTIISR